MKLIYLLTVTNDNHLVLVLRGGLEIARYDGRDSIDEEYNNETVLSVYTSGNALCIEI